MEVGFEYTVDVNQMLSNQKIWRAIINGFPYKTANELGVENDQDAFLLQKNKKLFFKKII